VTCGNLKCDLMVEPLPGGACSIEPVTDDGTVRVDALDIPELTARLYRACGTEPPVMLGRPEVDPSKPMVAGKLQVWKEPDGRVGFMPADPEAAQATGALRLEPHAVRQLAAVAVAYADAGTEDDGEFELAAILAAHPGATFPELARAVLAEFRVERREEPRG
jgi:hypothetical protein